MKMFEKPCPIAIRQSDIEYDNEIGRFWKIHTLGGSAALDVDSVTGNVACVTGNLADSLFSGFNEAQTPPIPKPYTEHHHRIMETVKGNLRYDFWVEGCFRGEQNAAAR